MERNTKTEDLIRNSVDARFFRFRAIVITCVYVFSVIFILLICLLNTDSEIVPVMIDIMIASIMLCSFMCLPLIFYYFGTLIQLMRHIERYRFYEVMLNKPCSDMRRTLYFIVEFQDENGDTIRINTNTVFRIDSIWEQPLEDYINKTAQIAYDKTKDRIVVTKIHTTQENTQQYLSTNKEETS